MAGYKRAQGEILNCNPSEAELWEAFNNFFNLSSSRKTTTYKFGLLKAILSNLENAVDIDDNLYLNFNNIFTTFTEIYWNQVLKYKVKQSHFKDKVSKIEQILLKVAEGNVKLYNMEFKQTEKILRNEIVKQVKTECKEYVLGALYNDFQGIVYGFYKNKETIWLSYNAYEFMKKYKSRLESTNYCVWAEFLVAINKDNSLMCRTNKVEYTIDERNDIHTYKQLLIQY